MIEDRIIDLITRKFTDELSSEELMELEEWIKESPDHESYYREYEELWFSATVSNVSSKYDVDAAIEAFFERTGAYKQQSKFRILRKFSLFGRIAAAILFFLTMAISIYFVNGTNDTNIIAQTTVESPEGSKTQITLPDGTVVKLNGGTLLRYSHDYGVSNRNVEVEGEAFFDVRKDSKRPFVIKSSTVCLTVKGTKFNFRDYADESSSSVTLQAGSVSLTFNNTTSKEYTIIPGQRITYDKKQSIAKIEPCDVPSDIGWMYDKIILNGRTLEDIAHILQHAYNKEIEICDPSLKSLRFHGEFSQKNSIEDVLDALTETGRIRYRNFEGKINLYIN